MPYERDVAVHEFPLGIAPKLVLRRLLPAGSCWELDDAAGDWIFVLTVQEAARLAGRRWPDVEQATRVELEYWDPTNTWRGSFGRPHPNPDEAVQQMLRKWRRLVAGRPEPRLRVSAADLPLALALAHQQNDPGVHITVTGHRAAGDHEVTVHAVLEESAARDVDTIAIVAFEDGYVQLMDRKRKPTIYVEAADLDAREIGALTEHQRRALRELGWSDPKTDLIPYEDPGYSNEWRGENFAREWPRDGDVRELAQTLTQTLALYGFGVSDDLNVDLFPMDT